MSEQIKKDLANCVQDLTAAEQAQARANIDAQQTLVAGDGITITNNVISSSGGGLRQHVAELVLDHVDGTYAKYKVVGCINNAINHVIVHNHSYDICDLWIEAPDIDTTANAYNYTVEFNCTNSGGTCGVDVQSARPVQVEDYSLSTDPDTGDPVLVPQWVTQETVSFTTNPVYQVRVHGNAWEVKKF